MLKDIQMILRRFGKQKLTTALHITGITLGITVCLMIGLFIRHELSFDMYHPAADRIYRLTQVWTEAGVKDYHFSTPFPLAGQIRKDIPGLEHVTQVHHPFEAIIEITPEKRFNESKIIYTDTAFPEVFQVKTVKGNLKEALSRPNQAVLTESLAKKYYGSEDPIGKVFKFKNKFNITVGALIEDFPGNTHLPASMLLSLSNDEDYLGTRLTHYGSTSGGTTFFVLPEGVKPGKNLQDAFTGIFDRQLNNQSWMDKDSRVDVEIQPLSDVHFNSRYAGGGQLVKAINTSWLWFFGSVGFVVLILACINFVNLSTAQAMMRAKEVGVRKTVGARKFQLIAQFLKEALLLVTIAAFIAIIITKISLPFVNSLIDKHITFHILQSPLLAGILLAGIIFTTLLAGIYPSWLLSKFKRASVLKSGSVNSKGQSSFLRRGLVVTQFSISVCLLIAVVLIGRQLNYLRTKNLGFDKDNTVIATIPFGTSEATRKLFKTELSAYPEVKDISFSTSPPSGEENTHWSTMMSVNGSQAKDRQSVTIILTDERYYSMYGLKLIAGRFPEATDTHFVSSSLPEGQRFAKSLINERCVKALGFESNAAALGEKFWTGINGWTAEVVGVVEDFNTGPLNREITPALITQYPEYATTAGIKLEKHSNLPAVLDKIARSYKTAIPQSVFEFNFLDQQLEALYKSEERLFHLFKIFSTLAILISCLGLWGLITFAAQQRTKEIGIRKVLGASISNIVTLLVRDFVALIGVAFVIAVPITYWGIHKWLEDFAYRIDIGWTVFVISGVSALLIALLTISFQAVKAAMANPVKSLRTE